MCSFAFCGSSHSQDLVVVKTVVGFGAVLNVDVLRLSAQVFIGNMQNGIDIIISSVFVVVHLNLDEVDNGVVIQALIGGRVEAGLVVVHLLFHLEKDDIVIIAVIPPAEWVSPSAEFGLTNFVVLIELSVEGRVVIELTKIWKNGPLNVRSLLDVRGFWIGSVSWVHLITTNEAAVTMLVV